MRYYESVPMGWIFSAVHIYWSMITPLYDSFRNYRVTNSFEHLPPPHLGFGIQKNINKPFLWFPRDQGSVWLRYACIRLNIRIHMTGRGPLFSFQVLQKNNLLKLFIDLVADMPNSRGSWALTKDLGPIRSDLADACWMNTYRQLLTRTCQSTDRERPRL